MGSNEPGQLVIDIAPDNDEKAADKLALFFISKLEPNNQQEWRISIFLGHQINVLRLQKKPIGGQARFYPSSANPPLPK